MHRSGTASFWQTLVEGANLPSTVPLARWDLGSCYAPDLLPGKMCVQPAGLCMCMILKCSVWRTSGTLQHVDYFQAPDGSVSARSLLHT